MLRFAVTGGIACGKSLVATLLAEEGIAVCEADELAHRVIASGQPAFREIVREFGREVIGSDGEVDRQVLGARVFGCRGDLDRLNRIVHPRVIRLWEEWLVGQERRRRGGGDAPPGESRGVRAAAVVIPLLYEVGAVSGWDAVICVAASEKTQLGRLAQRGLTAGQARSRINAQMGVLEKMARADYVMVNDGGSGWLREQARRVAGRILGT